MPVVCVIISLSLKMLLILQEWRCMISPKTPVEVIQRAVTLFVIPSCKLREITFAKLVINIIQILDRFFYIRESQICQKSVGLHINIIRINRKKGCIILNSVLVLMRLICRKNKIRYSLFCPPLQFFPIFKLHGRCKLQVIEITFKKTGYASEKTTIYLPCYQLKSRSSYRVKQYRVIRRYILIFMIDAIEQPE